MGNRGTEWEEWWDAGNQVGNAGNQGGNAENAGSQGGNDGKQGGKSKKSEWDCGEWYKI